MDKKALIKALRDTVQSASNTVASGVSAPVDLIAAGLRKVGLPIPQAPVGGSQWMENIGLTVPVEDGIPKMAGDFLGMIVPMAATAKAPQIAAAANRGLENLTAPQTLNTPGYRGQRGAVGFVYPQQEALDIAQRNAAKPVSEGGLGLPPNNTPMDRAKAMGFDLDTQYHGTKGDIYEFDKSASGRSTNTKNVFKNSISTTNDPLIAFDYAINADVREKKLFIDALKKKEKERKNLYKLEAKMYEGKISKDEYKKLQDSAWDSSSYSQYADTPGMTGFGHNTDIAKKDANILPLLIKKGIHVYPEKWNQTVVKNALKGVSEPVTFHNVPDVIGTRNIDHLHNTTIIQDPSHIRSRFAAFDPARINENDILGYADPRLLGLLGLGTGVGLGLYNYLGK